MVKENRIKYTYPCNKCGRSNATPVGKYWTTYQNGTV